MAAAPPRGLNADPPASPAGDEAKTPTSSEVQPPRAEVASPSPAGTVETVTSSAGGMAKAPLLRKTMNIAPPPKAGAADEAPADKAPADEAPATTGVDGVVPQYPRRQRQLSAH